MQPLWDRMVLKAEQNDHKKYEITPLRVLISMLCAEVAELCDSLKGLPDPEAVWREAADVANFAWMVAEKGAGPAPESWLWYKEAMQSVVDQCWDGTYCSLCGTYKHKSWCPVGEYLERNRNAGQQDTGNAELPSSGPETDSGS